MVVYPPARGWHCLLGLLVVVDGFFSPLIPHNHHSFSRLSSSYAPTALDDEPVPCLQVVGRAMLPGNRDCLHVFKPDWLAFFNHLLQNFTTTDADDSGSGSGKACLPKYVHCLEGSSVGVLMEVLDYRRLEAGRLLIVSHGVSRVRLREGPGRCDERGGPLYVERHANFVPDDEVAALVAGRAEAVAWEARWASVDLPRGLERSWAAKGCDALTPTPGMGTFTLPEGAGRGVGSGSGGTGGGGGGGGGEGWGSAVAAEALATELVGAEGADADNSVDEATPAYNDSLVQGAVDEAVAAAEGLVWEELATFVNLAGRLRSTGSFCLPAALLALRPAVAPPDAGYHPLRRAWRLSFAMAQVLDVPKGTDDRQEEEEGDDEEEGTNDDDDDDDEGRTEDNPPISRQALLECESTAERLSMVLSALAMQRKMMAAALAMESVTRRGTTGPGADGR